MCKIVTLNFAMHFHGFNIITSYMDLALCIIEKTKVLSHFHCKQNIIIEFFLFSFPEGGWGKRKYLLASVSGYKGNQEMDISRWRATRYATMGG